MKVQKTETAKKSDARFEKLRVTLGVLLLLLVATTGVQYYRVTSCQTQYNARVADALSQRSEAQRLETQAQLDKALAQRQFLTSLGADPVSNKEATDRYIQTLDSQVTALTDLERVRRLNPVPPAPNCGAF